MLNIFILLIKSIFINIIHIFFLFLSFVVSGHLPGIFLHYSDINQKNILRIHVNMYWDINPFDWSWSFGYLYIIFDLGIPIYLH